MVTKQEFLQIPTDSYSKARKAYRQFSDGMRHDKDIARHWTQVRRKRRHVLREALDDMIHGVKEFRDTLEDAHKKFLEPLQSKDKDTSNKDTST